MEEALAFRRLQAAERLNISVFMVDKLIKAGRLSAVKVGATVLITPESLDALLRGDR